MNLLGNVSNLIPILNSGMLIKLHIIDFSVNIGPERMLMYVRKCPIQSKFVFNTSLKRCLWKPRTHKRTKI